MMMNRTLLLLIVGASLGVQGQSMDFAPEIPWRQTETQPGVHDPSVIRDDRGVYTLMSTNNLLSVMQSTDKTHWTPKGRLLDGVPGWMNTAYPGIENLWAPHVARMNGRYWVYYCGSLFGKNTSLIGAMSSPTLDVASPEYKWTDAGEVWRSRATDDYNAIDPEILVEASGKAWMSFGSFWQGLRMIAIDPATGKQSGADRTLYRIASRQGGGIEGPSTLQHGGWTYLFAPFDRCCDGVNSTYRTMYGRSAKPTGPFLDEAGKEMGSGGGTQLLGTYGRYVGPGGGSPFHDGRRDNFALHYYDRNRNGASILQLREILYREDGWLEFGQPFLGRHWALEAEHAVVSGTQILQAPSGNASNGEYLASLATDGSQVEFRFQSFQAGVHQVVVRYAAADGEARHKLTVNGVVAPEVVYPRTAAWANFPAGQTVVVEVDLRKGLNRLRFAKGTGLAQIDRIDIVRKADESLLLGGFDRFPKATWDSLHDAVVLPAGASATYENIGFGEGGKKSVELCAASGGGTVRLRLGAGLEQDLEVSAGCKVHVLSTNLQTLRGIRDLELVGLTATAPLQKIRFLTSLSGASPARKVLDSSLDRLVDPLGRARTKSAGIPLPLTSTLELHP